MDINGKQVLVCDCEGTMALGAKPLGRALGGEVAVNTQLCRAQLANFERALKDGKPLLVACTQEAPLFLETHDEIEGAPEVSFVNVRERAGWSTDGTKTLPKIAALIAEAALDLAPATAVTMESKGSVLVIGKDDAAIAAAKRLAARLDPTVLLIDAAETPPPRLMDVAVFRGKIKGASGHLGAFKVEIENLAAAQPSSRASLAFDGGGKAGASECDLILDLRGEPALFPAPEKRDGYFRPDPGNPAEVERALFDLADMVGSYDKPRYVAYDAAICAHQRSGKVGCRRCLDVCPTSAIADLGDAGVAYDAFICAGCGMCASVCPTGAVAYQLPAGNGIFERLRTILGAYAKAGGEAPVLLLYGGDAGDETIDTLARYGDGLPARVLPFQLSQPTQVGLDFLLTAAAYGAEQVLALVPHRRTEEAAALKEQMTFAETVLEGLGYGSGRFAVIDEADPDVVGSRLWGLAPAPGCAPGEFLAIGRKRAILSLALEHLHAHAPNPVDTLALPAGAPFGAVQVRTEGCTLCLACVGACPTGALKDNPELPQLSFNESLCVQCGLCRVTCPEKVIALEPRLSFLAAARAHQVVKEEEPFHCVRCGKPFGTKSSIDRIADRLKAHPMFADPGKLDRLRMCDNCRVVAMTEDEVHPFAGAARPKPRTTEDYLREREELRAQAAADMKAKGLLPPKDNG